MTLTYDEFGNPINPNYQYTYDQTGHGPIKRARRTRRTARKSLMSTSKTKNRPAHFRLGFQFSISYRTFVPN